MKPSKSPRVPPTQTNYDENDENTNVAPYEDVVAQSSETIAQQVQSNDGSASQTTASHNKQRGRNTKINNYSENVINSARSKDKVTDPSKFLDDVADTVVSDVSGEDLEPVDILLQYIPYYGQGDPSNDSIVRSALSSLSVEDIDSTDEYGNSLLLLACQYRCEDLVRIMLNKGANPNAVNSAGACCLHFACYRDSASYNIAKILVQNGANPDIAETTYGCTPLHYCASNGDIEFCKLLLSFGAQINALDYYNYTCVDYARDAQFSHIVDFLQLRLDRFNSQNHFRTGGGGSAGGGGTGGLSSTKSFRFSSTMSLGGGGGGQGPGSSGKPYQPYADLADWESHMDPSSGAKYFINLKNGECLWEGELKQRVQQYQAQQQPSPPSRPPPPGDIPTNTNTFAASASTPAFVPQSVPAVAPKTSNESVVVDNTREKALLSQATLARLTAFLTKHDPARLLEMSALLTRYVSREEELFRDLCKQYNVAEDSELLALHQKLASNTATSVAPAPAIASPATTIVGVSNDIVVDIKRVDPMLVQSIAQEQRKKVMTEMEEEFQQWKRRNEQQQEEENNTFRQLISEKDGLIAKLQSEIENVKKEKISIEV